MSRLIYVYSADFDVYEHIDGTFIVVVDGRPVCTQPTREAAKKWIEAELAGQSAWKRQAKWKNGGFDD